jgi:hypothetical protein
MSIAEIVALLITGAALATGGLLAGAKIYKWMEGWK